MANLLYIVVLILIIGWVVGFFVYGADGLIHTLLIIAIVAVAVNFIGSRRRIRKVE